MKKRLCSQVAAFILLTTFLLAGCSQSGNTPVDEYISKIRTSGENALKGVPGGGAEFYSLMFKIKDNLRGMRFRANLYSQPPQYYSKEFDKLDVYDEKLSYLLDNQRIQDDSAKEDAYSKEYLKQHEKFIFHPVQLREGKVHTLGDNVWAYEGVSQGTRIFIVFTKNSELGLSAILVAPTLELAKNDYKIWQSWWESTGKNYHHQRIEREKKAHEESEKSAIYEKQKPERDVAVASVQHDMLSLLEFSNIKYEVIEDRGSLALLLKFKVKQSTERPVHSIECDIIIKNKDQKIVDIIRIEDRHKINFEPNKLYIHEIGVKPQSKYRQNLVKKISTDGYTATIKPASFYNGEVVPTGSSEIEKKFG